MNELFECVSYKIQYLDEKKEFGYLSVGVWWLIFGIIVIFLLILVLICVIQLFNLLVQFIFLMLLWGVVLIVWWMLGCFLVLMLIVLLLIVFCCYIWWCYIFMLNWDDLVSLVCGFILFFVEMYVWIVLVFGYFQVVWLLNCQLVLLLKDMLLWLLVDIFVLIYNEDFNVVKNIIYVLLGIDWLKDKLNIWIFDDGGREEFCQFV